MLVITDIWRVWIPQNGAQTKYIASGVEGVASRYIVDPIYLRIVSLYLWKDIHTHTNRNEREMSFVECTAHDVLIQTA